MTKVKRYFFPAPSRKTLRSISDSAVGTAINDKPIPRPVMKLQIRQGVLGTMPSFSEKELSDQQVELILDYVDALQQHGG